jgi:rhamnogalacturonyl hydrolase YesR
MIDTDKYEGHTEGKWNVLVSSGEDITQAHLHDETAGYYFFSQGYNREQEENYNHNESRANARLMCDAPLLLAEVKRLREETSILKNALRRCVTDYTGHEEVWYEVNRILKGDEE